MKKQRKPTSLPIHQLLVVISLALPIVSAQAESRAPKPNEGELAVELFGLIAEQSGCSRYAVAWLESTTQQVVSRCAETLQETDRVATVTEAKMRFVIDVPKSLAEYRRHFKKNALRSSSAVLAHLLAHNRGLAWRNDYRSPLLVYRYSDHQSEANSGKAKLYSASPPDSMFLFSNE